MTDKSRTQSKTSGKVFAKPEKTGSKKTSPKHENSIRPYDKEEWQKIAREWLATRKADSSMLTSAYIALRCDDPTLAEKCREEAARRRKTLPSF